METPTPSEIARLLETLGPSGIARLLRQLPRRAQQFICAECGGEFVATRNDARWCTNTCAVRAWRRRQKQRLPDACLLQACSGRQAGQAGTDEEAPATG